MMPLAGRAGGPGPGGVVPQTTYQAGSVGVLVGMTRNDDRQPGAADGRPPSEASLPVVIATILREEGHTGVQTHVRQLRRYLKESGTPSTLITPFSWGRALTVPVFGLRLALER